MKFNNGYFGACICVLALLGTAIGGYVLNIEKDTREVTKFNYIADISGLFNYTDAPEYISYNPSSNYVGYSHEDVVYTPSSTVNNYRYVLSEGTTTTLVTTAINKTSDYGSAYATWPNDAIVTAWNESSVQFSANNPESIIPGAQDGHYLVPTLADALLSISPTYRSYASLEVELANNPDSHAPVFFYAGDWIRSEVVLPGGYSSVSYSATFTDNNLPDKFVINVPSDMASAYRGDTIVWQANINDIGVFNKYIVPATGDINLRDTQTWIQVKGISYPTYGFMQPSAGVKATTTVAEWSNGYNNSLIDVKISKNGDVAGNQSVEFNIGDSTVAFTYISGTLSYVNGSLSDVGAESVPLGSWLAVQMRVDALSGKIILTPTNDANMLTTVEPTEYSTVLEDYFTPGVLDTFEVSIGSNVNNSMKFQVTDTMVFLNTYNTVMIDPSITVSDWFPDMARFRLNFYSFAILGDSMTINGQSCPIDRDSGTITFTNVAGFTYTKKLENFYLTYEDNVTITFVNDGSSYDLGTLTDAEVSFSGMWYFITGLYEPVQASETYWNWNLNGFQASAGECLVIFLTIIGAGVLVYVVWGKGKLGFLDWVVIILAVFFGSAILGF